MKYSSDKMMLQNYQQTGISLEWLPLRAYLLERRSLPSCLVKVLVQNDDITLLVLYAQHLQRRQHDSCTISSFAGIDAVDQLLPNAKKQYIWIFEKNDDFR